MYRNIFPKVLLALAFLSGASSQFAAAQDGETKMLALVIGNSAYAGGKLDGPTYDAADMAVVLQNIGFKISNGKVADLDRAAMYKVAQEFLNAIDENTVAVVYYSGHGLEDNHVNFLVPVDAKLESIGDVPTQLMPLDWLLTRLNQREARAKIVILDACRDMPMALKFKSIGQKSGLASIKDMIGTRVIYATSPNSVAIPAAPGERNSVFTAALLRAIRERQTTFDAVIVRAAQLTAEATKKRQSPWSTGNIVSFPMENIAHTNPLIRPPEVTQVAPEGPRFAVQSAPCTEVSQQVILNGRVTWKKVCN